MHDHRSGGPLSPLPDPGSLEYQAQKLVLLELVVDPPHAGDRLSTLVRNLDIPGFRSSRPSLRSKRSDSRRATTTRSAPPRRRSTSSTSGR